MMEEETYRTQTTASAPSCSACSRHAFRRHGPGLIHHLGIAGQFTADQCFESGGDVFSDVLRLHNAAFHDS
jgi:hypothetical protein